MKSNKYLIVFDSNVLNVRHDKRGDFTRFHFHSTFDNIIDKLEELDIYPNVSVAIPIVVWEEMKEQKIEDYYKKIQQVVKNVEKFLFPGYKLIYDLPDNFSYETYISQKIEEFKRDLLSRQVSFIDLDLPSEKRYSFIVERAIKKKPPFEGKGNNSDKGFKDTLLWESILEFIEGNDGYNVLFYTKDKMFNDELLSEFADKYPYSGIQIFRETDESSLVKQLEIIAKEIDKYAFIPEETDEFRQIREWLFSEVFKAQFNNWLHILNATNKYISYKDINVLDVIDIVEELPHESSNFSASINVEIVFDVFNGPLIRDNYSLSVLIEIIDECIIHIEDISVDEIDDGESI